MSTNEEIPLVSQSRIISVIFSGNFYMECKMTIYDPFSTFLKIPCVSCSTVDISLISFFS